MFRKKRKIKQSKLNLNKRKIFNKRILRKSFKGSQPPQQELQHKTVKHNHDAHKQHP